MPLKPRTFVEKKIEPGLGVPTSVDRNTRLALENIIENLKRATVRIEALEDSVVTRASASSVGSGDGDSGTEIEELIDAPAAPSDAPETYLRFERDGDGDVQAIYIGTVD